MELKQSFHMNKGHGTKSYARNSHIQRKILLRSSLIIEEAIAECLKNTQPESMGIADLGCSSGPNALIAISNMVNAVYSTCTQTKISLPELRVSLNDLFDNDFNEIFVSLPEFYNILRQETGIGLEGCLVSAVAGSFYGRLFPVKSLHFVLSSSSLHWLSKVPEVLSPSASEYLNKGNIYITKTSPKSVLEAYLSQFQSDFFAFLKSRSEEVVVGGRMVLMFPGQTSEPNYSTVSFMHETVALALLNMTSEGLIDEEKIDSFNLPMYIPSLDEVKNVIEEEASFSISLLETIETNLKAELPTAQSLSRGEYASLATRAVLESMLVAHFGSEIVDELFARFVELVNENFPQEKLIILVISVIRIDYQTKQTQYIPS